MSRAQYSLLIAHVLLVGAITGRSAFLLTLGLAWLVAWLIQLHRKGTS